MVKRQKNGVIILLLAIGVLANTGFYLILSARNWSWEGIIIRIPFFILGILMLGFPLGLYAIYNKKRKGLPDVRSTRYYHLYQGLGWAWSLMILNISWYPKVEFTFKNIVLWIAFYTLGGIIYGSLQKRLPDTKRKKNNTLIGLNNPND